eukprot:366273-Chlamydomonas_euryale.AAC.14
MDGQQTPGDYPAGRSRNAANLTTQKTRPPYKSSKRQGSRAEKWGCTACRGSNQRAEPNTLLSPGTCHELMNFTKKLVLLPSCDKHINWSGLTASSQATNIFSPYPSVGQAGKASVLCLQDGQIPATATTLSTPRAASLHVTRCHPFAAWHNTCDECVEKKHAPERARKGAESGRVGQSQSYKEGADPAWVWLYSARQAIWDQEEEVGMRSLRKRPPARHTSGRGLANTLRCTHDQPAHMRVHTDELVMSLTGSQTLDPHRMHTQCLHPEQSAQHPARAQHRKSMQ